MEIDRFHALDALVLHAIHRPTYAAELQLAVEIAVCLQRLCFGRRRLRV